MAVLKLTDAEIYYETAGDGPAMLFLSEIGELFGGRDHTTVLHAVRKIGGERQQMTELNQQLHVLEQTLKG